MKTPLSSLPITLLLIFLGLSAQGCAEGNTVLGTCGNGQVDATEQCDKTDLNGATCITEGYSSGTLSCSESCTFNTDQCEGSCQDQCTSGASRCSGNIIEICGTGGSGCLAWASDTDCTASSQVCDDTSGSASCADSCTDACTLSETRCQGEVVQECQQGENGCTQWVDGEDCSTSGGTCTGGTCGCDSECVAPGSRCNGNVAESCATDLNGCTFWSVVEDCTTAGEVCDASSGTAQCAATCSDACTAGQTDCLGDIRRSCVLFPSGCYDWQEDENCASSSRSCSGGSCICNDACSSGQTTCSGDTVQSCTADSYGCYSYTDTTDCTANSQVCLDGACASAGNGFTCSAVSSFNSIQSTGTAITTATSADDARYAFTIPFSFSFMGASYTTGYMCTNGWVPFGSDPGTNGLTNTTLPNTATPNGAIYVFWDDLEYDQATWSDGQMLYTTQGSAPNRVFILEWAQMFHYNTTTDHGSFQLRLYETSNAFEVSYDRTNWLGTGYSATIGYEDATGTEGGDIGSTLTGPPADDYYCVPD